MRLDKINAIILRKKGKSYNEISQILTVPKSTLSDWLSKEKWSNIITKKLAINNSLRQANRLREYSKLRAKEAFQRNNRVLKSSSNEIERLKQKELKIIGAMLYWAEGAKTQRARLLFVNSDPRMIMIMMKFFRNVVGVSEKKFQISVQIHPNISEKKAKKFWSEITGVPVVNFRKTSTQISNVSKKKRNKRSLPFGTCRININSTIDFHRVMGWIQGIINQIG